MREVLKTKGDKGGGNKYTLMAVSMRAGLGRIFKRGMGDSSIAMGMRMKESLEMTRRMVGGLIMAMTGMSMWVSGKMINKRARGTRSLRMDQSSKGLTRMARSMDTESTNGAMDVSTKETSSTTISTVRESTTGIPKSTTENGFTR